jgi:hypothetical protein
MISRADVENIRARDATPGSPVLSVYYLDVDQSRAGNRNRKFEARLKTRLHAIEEECPRAEREPFRADAARVMRFVSNYQPHAETLVLFADDSSDFFWSGVLRVVLGACRRSFACCTPSTKTTPARTSGRRCAPSRRRHRACAMSRSL